MPAKTSKLPRIILDSNCLIDVITDHDGNSAEAKRVISLIDGHNKDFVILLPTIIKLETLAVGSTNKNGKDGNSPAKRQDNFNKIRQWFNARAFLQVDIDARLIRHTEEIIYDHGLKAPDAMILATAELYKAEKIYTYDAAMLRCNGQFSSAIEKPPSADKLFTTDGDPLHQP